MRYLQAIREEISGCNFLSDLGICLREEAETYVAKVIADAVSQVVTVKEKTTEENNDEESDAKN